MNNNLTLVIIQNLIDYLTLVDVCHIQKVEIDVKERPIVLIKNVHHIEGIVIKN